MIRACRIYEYVQQDYDHYWTPIDGLLPPQDNYLTLVFIASCHVLYRGIWEHDSIFRKPVENKDYPGFYVNPYPLAFPLACVDEIQVCTKNDRSTCSPVHPASDSKNGFGYEFARLALRKSKAYDSIHFRMGTGLLAQDLVGQFQSAPLCGSLPTRECEYTQWILEARALFETSLARMQLDARDIARGLHSIQGLPYHDDTAPWAQGNKLCERLKVQLPPGYRNVNILTTTFYVLGVLLLVLLQLDSHFLYPEPKNRYFGVKMTKAERYWYSMKGYPLTECHTPPEGADSPISRAFTSERSNEERSLLAHMGPSNNYGTAFSPQTESRPHHSIQSATSTMSANTGLPAQPSSPVIDRPVTTEALTSTDDPPQPAQTPTTEPIESPNNLAFSFSQHENEDQRVEQSTRVSDPRAGPSNEPASDEVRPSDDGFGSVHEWPSYPARRGEASEFNHPSSEVEAQVYGNRWRQHAPSDRAVYGP